MINKIISYTLYIVLWSLLNARPSLPLDPNKTMTQYMLNIWTADDGLPQNSVYSILQDSDGYIWLGTQEGLVRFDGIRFTVFDKRNTPAIRHNYIVTILEDRNRTLWIGTNGGGLIAYKNDQWKTYTIKDGLSSDFISSLAEDNTGNLWIGTNGGGLNRLSDGHFTVFTTEQGLAHSTVYYCYPDRSGRVWIGTANGLNVYDNGKFITYTIANGLADNSISAIYEDNIGRVWIGTKTKGLSVYHQGRFTNFTSRDGLSGDMINYITQDRNGNIWISTRIGLTRYTADGRFSRRTIQEGLTVNHLKSILEDREGSLWIGTDGGGLYRLKDEKFINITTYDGLSYDMIRCIYEDRKKRLLVGTSGGGLNILDGNHCTILNTKNGLSHNMVWSVYEDPDGAYWIGTDGGGITVYKDGRLKYYNSKTGLSHDNVRAIIGDRQNRIWVGTVDGLNIYHQGKWSHYTVKDRLPHKTVYTIEEGRDGAVWIGTGGGLIRWRNDKWTYYNTANGLSSDIVLTTYEDSEGVLWVGTDGGGLNRLKNDHWTIFRIADGLFDDLIYRILEDSSGYLWMSCNKGIFKIKKDELARFSEGKQKTILSRAYSTADGMASNECNGRNQPAGWKRYDGTLCFPGVKGVVTIDPEKSIINPMVPPVQIEYIIADDSLYTSQTLKTYQQAIFPPGTEKIEIHYTALSYLNPGQVRFRYRLENFDKQLVEADTRRTAYYTNLPPGKYSFRVIACNNDGLWNETGATVVLNFEPRFFQTDWFYVLCVIFLTSGAYGLYRYRINRIEKRRKELEILVTQKTRQIELQKNELAQALENLKNTQMQLVQSAKMSSLGQLTAGIAHEINNPIAFISANMPFLKKHIEVMDHLIHAAKNLLKDEAAEQFDRIMIDVEYQYIRSDIEKMLISYENGAERIKNIVVNLRLFSRLDENERKTTQINDDLDATLSLIASQTQNRIRIFRNYGNLPKIECSPGQLNQVFMHIIRNAVQAIDDTGEIHITTSAENNHISISIRDTGCGMTEEIRNRLFEPFFTTRDIGKGTGLGLSISYGIIKNHNGSIEVHSEPGKGSEFIIRLPVNGS